MFTIFLACSGPSTDSGLADPPPVTYELGEVVTTLTGRWAPNVVTAPPITVFDWTEYADHGLGVHYEDGSTWVEHDTLVPEFVEGTERRSVAWIWQAADPQLIDEESPIRLSAWDLLYRPQGHLTTQVFEAHVRTAQAISDAVDRPYDFALLAGDLSDGAQKNELQWFLAAMNGGVIDPDSGVPDDPVAGPGNDFNDPFESDGLDAPWYAVAGNHDAMYIGGFSPVTEDIREASQGEDVYEFLTFPNGYRDGSDPAAPVLTEGPTPADDERLVLTMEEYEDLIGPRTFSVLPDPALPLRVIGVNTVNHTIEDVGAGSEGAIDADTLAWLDGELDAADAAGELAIVMTHHRSKDLQRGDTSEDEFVAVLGSHPSVVLHVTGHGHSNVDYTQTQHEHGYFELMLASTLDFPQQSRLIELVDEGNGSMSIYCTNIDHASPEDSLGHLGRSLAAGKHAFPLVGSSPDIEGMWASDVPNQNLLLRVPLSATQQELLSTLDLPAGVTSVDDLPNL
ncbi:MAG: hypothetical protein GY913_24420 [Proteobacteria bacterium]|nr:hypothetical protein [Pseudomonadota bacterium]MCP4920059.1 hypothetical protein [Pseudomonadota bacterium]